MVVHPVWAAIAPLARPDGTVGEGLQRISGRYRIFRYRKSADDANTVSAGKPEAHKAGREPVETDAANRLSFVRVRI